MLGTPSSGKLPPVSVLAKRKASTLFCSQKSSVVGMLCFQVMNIPQALKPKPFLARRSQQLSTCREQRNRA